jgi:hypothetical protein
MLNLSDNDNNDDSSGLRHLSNQPYTLKLCILQDAASDTVRFMPEQEKRSGLIFVTDSEALGHKSVCRFAAGCPRIIASFR